MSIRQGNNLIAGTPDVTGKADTDLSNLTTTGKSYGASLALPSDSYVDLSWSANPNTQTAPANGWMFVAGITSTVQQYVNATTYIDNNVAQNVVRFGKTYWTPASNGFAFIIPVKKDDIVRFEAGPNQLASISYFRFIYAEGEI